MSAWLAALGEAERRLLLRALLVCLFTAVAAGPLGCVLLVRRTALMADALAHGLLPGVGLAWLLVGASLPALFIGGLAAGLATALAAALVSRLTRLKEDAAFAAVFATLFAAGVLLVGAAATPVDLLHLLFGQLLAVGPAELRLAAAVSALTVAAFALFHRPILAECFDPVFHRACGGRGALVHTGLLALTVLVLVAALQALGVVLALGLFMLPAATAYLWCDRWGRMLVAAAAIAAAGAFAGFVLSCRSGLPPGACIVAVLGAGFLASAVGSPRHGLLARLRHPAHHHREEDEAPCPVPPQPPAAGG